MHLQQYRSSKGTVMDSCLDKISEVLYVGTGHSAVAAFPRRLPNQNPMFSWLENSTGSIAYFPAA
jgi:hypothetical protein